MKFMCLLPFIFFLCIYVIAQKTYLDSKENIYLFRKFKYLSLLIFEKTGEKARIREAAREKKIVQDPISKDVPFPCNVEGSRSLEVPTSVHKLRPGDIDIIASLGDSLTAGSGALATELYHFLTDNRGVSFLGGGEETWREYLTLANILKEFNPKLFGYATTDSHTFQEGGQFNLATLGAMSQDLPFMAKSLVKLMENDPRVDIKNHWKFITIMMGSNDFCSDMCYLENPSWTIDYHKNNLTAALRIIRDNLPRTFISLLPPPHMSDFINIKGILPHCFLIREIECPCLFGPMGEKNKQQMFNIMTRVQMMDEEIANNPEFDRDDFTVVFQPSNLNLTLDSAEDGYVIKTYLSSDCFHMSQKVHARAANAAWNTLLEPVGKKSIGWDDPFKNFNCPTSEWPFIYTSRNSNKTAL